jgi:hypothetical protein
MDEDKYRQVYQEMNPTRCYFEKLLLLRYGHCQQANKLFLAEREAFACRSVSAQKNCQLLLENLRSNARFSLQVSQAIDSPLPHTKEIKVQVGGLFGLQQLLSNKNMTQTDILQDNDAKFGEQAKNHAPIENIVEIVNDAIKKYQQLESIPYNELVKTIMSFTLAKRKRKSQRKK